MNMSFTVSLVSEFFFNNFGAIFDVFCDFTHFFFQEFHPIWLFTIRIFVIRFRIQKVACKICRLQAEFQARIFSEVSYHQNDNKNQQFYIEFWQMD